MISVPANSQALYKYQGENGEWIYSDRPPPDDREVEIRGLRKGSGKSSVKVDFRAAGAGIRLFATNDFHAPVELRVGLTNVQGLAYPQRDMNQSWVLPPKSETTLFDMAFLETVARPSLEFEYEYVVGRPDARHEPESPYRVPYSLQQAFPVSQAYPDVQTHTTPDAYHAIDFAMPIGTDIVAARGGVVFDVQAANFEEGSFRASSLDKANVVRILHDDGTFGVYAHLNWNAIRVRTGDRVERGEYIADSGNTGFSSGPHLHFVVLKNSGMNLESVPVRFSGNQGQPVRAMTGDLLTAY